MNAHILSLGTATPSCKVSQNDAADLMVDLLGFHGAKASWLRQLYSSTAIETRSTVVSNQFSQIDFPFFYEIFSDKPPGMTARNALYKQEAPKLALEAAHKALCRWDGDVEAITHVVSVSCTGIITPGLDCLLLSMLDLKPSTRRLGINFMGCFGALKGLEVARALAREDENNRVLLVCTELCSLHMQPHMDLEVIVSNALFSDGAAAAIVGCDEANALYALTDQRSYCVAGTHDLMQWNGSDTGLLIKLSKNVPKCIQEHIEPFINDLLKSNGVDKDLCDWGIHPGGKAILQAIEKKMDLDRSDTAVSWEVLRNHGNMSSPTLLFVLETLSLMPSSKPWCPLLAFGPGLSIEGMLLCRDPQSLNS